MFREQKSKQDQISISEKQLKDVALIIKKLNFSIHLRKNFSLIQMNQQAQLRQISLKTWKMVLRLGKYEKLSETELEELKSLSSNEYPENFKIYLFDFCFLYGDTYSKYFLDLKQYQQFSNTIHLVKKHYKLLVWDTENSSNTEYVKTSDKIFIEFSHKYDELLQARQKLLN